MELKERAARVLNKLPGHSTENQHVLIADQAARIAALEQEYGELFSEIYMAHEEITVLRARLEELEKPDGQSFQEAAMRRP